MPEYLAPGVYVEEIEIGAKPIEGVSTSVAGFLGQTERGPIGPRLVTGFEQFTRLYGGHINESYLAYAVDGFFRNGGQRCYIGRVVGNKPVASSLTLESSEIKDVILVEAKSAGSSGNEIKVKVEAASESVPSELFKLTVTGPIEGGGETVETYDNLSSNPVSDDYYEKRVNEDSNLVILERKGSGTPDNKEYTNLSGGSEEATSSLTLASIEKTNVIKVEALGPGSWGNRIVVKVAKASLSKTDSTDGLFKLTVAYGKDAQPREDGDKLVGASVVEIYDNLSSDPRSSDHYVKRVNGVSNMVVLEQLQPKAPEVKELTPLSGGSDGDKVQKSDYQGTSDDPDKRSGLAAFEGIDEISIVCIPDENEVKDEDGANVLTKPLVEHCENMKDRFAILSSKQSAGDVGGIWPPEDSKYAAFYYPWIKVFDPLSNTNKLVPPGGHIAGVYARSDQERGVHKAPANEVLRGANELQVNVSKEDQMTLNPRGVNCIRAFPGRGIRVWGARTTSSDPLWKYVNVRRLFLFIEESIDEGTQWVVFEPNNERLWARVRQTINQFLTGVWRDGALMGNNQDEAFFVRCDRTTMTQDDIDNGRLIVLIGIAPVKPAEFVIFRIAQVAKGSEIAE
jgi:phage tail sheath protein FI